MKNQQLADLLRPTSFDEIVGQDHLFGKDGIVPGTIKQASDALEAREIIKCAIQQNCPLTAKEALNELCAELGAEPVQCIGRRFVMYRPSKENPRIVLE